MQSSLLRVRGWGNVNCIIVISVPTLEFSLAPFFLSAVIGGDTSSDDHDCCRSDGDAHCGENNVPVNRVVVMRLLMQLGM